MKRNLRFYILYLGMFIFSVLPCYSVDLSFDEVIDKALKNFYDVKVLMIESDMAEQKIGQVKSDYMPKFEFASNLQYDKNLEDDGTLTSVGGDVLLNRSLYQNSMYFGLGYNLFDCGVRKRKLDIAKLEKLQKQVDMEKLKRDLCLKIADLYVDSLLVFKEIISKNDILKNQKQRLQNKNKLSSIGLNSLIDVIEEDVETQDLIADIEHLESKLKRNLTELSYYTKEPYKFDNISFKPFRESGFVKISNLKNENKEKKTKAFALNAKINKLEIRETPEYRLFDIKLNKKNKEIQIAKRERLPSLKTYGGYYLYGTDNGDLVRTFHSLKKKNWMLRLQLSHTLFDGFKKRNEIQELELEKEKIEYEKQKELKKLKLRYQELKERNLSARNQIEIRSKILGLVDKQIAGLDKLYSQKLIEKDTFLEEKQELLEKKYELEKIIITCLLELYKVNLLTKGA